MKSYNDRVRERVKFAIGRLETALKYGADTTSSRDLCIRDAIDLLTPCDACKGVGWFVLQCWGSKRLPDGSWNIERCDSCAVISDEEANADPEAIEALRLAKLK